MTQSQPDKKADQQIISVEKIFENPFKDGSEVDFTMPSQSTEAIDKKSEAKVEETKQNSKELSAKVDFFFSPGTLIPVPPTPEQDEELASAPSVELGAELLFPHEPFGTPPPSKAKTVSPKKSLSVTPPPSSSNRSDQTCASENFDAFGVSFDAQFPLSFGTPKDRPPSLAIAFDVPVFRDPFFPGAASFNRPVSQGCAFEKQRSDRVQNIKISTDSRLPKASVDRKDKTQDATMKSQTLLPPSPPPASASPPPESTSLDKGHSSSGAPSVPVKKKGTEDARRQYENATAPAPERKPNVIIADESEGQIKATAIKGAVQTDNLSPNGVLRKLQKSVIRDNTLKAEKPHAFARGSDESSVHEIASEDINSSFENNGLGGSAKKVSHALTAIGEDEGKDEGVAKLGNGKSINPTKASSSWESDDNKKTSERVHLLDRSSFKENEPIQSLPKERNAKTFSSCRSRGGLSMLSATNPVMASASTSEKIAAAMDQEIRRLDNILGSSSSKEIPSSYSRRRSAQQPITYAEPSLNTKLRRGDKFFPKSDLMTN